MHRKCKILSVLVYKFKQCIHLYNLNFIKIPGITVTLDHSLVAYPSKPPVLSLKGTTGLTIFHPSQFCLPYSFA